MGNGQCTRNGEVLGWVGRTCGHQLQGCTWRSGAEDAGHACGTHAPETLPSPVSPPPLASPRAASQLPRQFTGTGEWATTDMLSMELAGFFLRRLRAPACSWVLVLSAGESLAASLVTRGHVGLNVLNGVITSESTEAERRKAMERHGDLLCQAVVQCNAVCPITWTQASVPGSRHTPPPTPPHT